MGDGRRTGRDQPALRPPGRDDRPEVGRAVPEPTWSSGPTATSGGTPKAGRAVATEQVTLYGLPVVSDRTIGYDRVDAPRPRAWFITKALVEGDVGRAGTQKFVARNAEFLEHVRAWRREVRRLEVVDDEMLFEFYDDRVGADVTSVRHFDTWWKRHASQRADAARPHRRRLRRTRPRRGLHSPTIPDTWRQGDDRASAHLQVRRPANRSTG